MIEERPRVCLQVLQQMAEGEDSWGDRVSATPLMSWPSPGATPQCAPPARGGVWTCQSPTPTGRGGVGDHILQEHTSTLGDMVRSGKGRGTALTVTPTSLRPMAYD